MSAKNLKDTSLAPSSDSESAFDQFRLLNDPPQPFMALTRIENYQSDHMTDEAPTASVTPTPEVPPQAAVKETPKMAAPGLQVQLLSPKGKAPTRGSAFAAGYDIYRYDLQIDC